MNTNATNVEDKLISIYIFPQSVSVPNNEVIFCFFFLAIRQNFVHHIIKRRIRSILFALLLINSTFDSLVHCLRHYIPNGERAYRC